MRPHGTRKAGTDIGRSGCQEGSLYAATWDA